MLLNEMEIFYQVVLQQSFSKAAAQLGVSKSYVSKRVTRLEQELGTRLVFRSTRKLRLTEAGEHFYQHCEKIIKEGEKAYSTIHELRGKPSGKLKISVPPAIALNMLSPVISNYAARCPDVVLDIRLESRLVNLIKEGYDLVLRSAVLESSNLIAQKIYTIENGVYATPSYLAKANEVVYPGDLANCDVAVYSDAKFTDKLTLVKHKKVEVVPLKTKITSNQLDFLKQCVLDDVCLGIFPRFMVQKEVGAQRLIPLLENYSLSESNLYAVCPDREYVPPKLRIFLDILKSHLQLMA